MHPYTVYPVPTVLLSFFPYLLTNKFLFYFLFKSLDMNETGGKGIFILFLFLRQESHYVSDGLEVTG